MRARRTRFRWLARTAVAAFLASILVIPLAIAAPVGAHSDVWHKNTFQVTHPGVFHADFLMPKWFEIDPFVIQIVGPIHVTHCTLRYGTTTERAREIDAGPYLEVRFVWPEKGLRSATRVKATCHRLTGGRVSAATVFLPLGMRESRITLRPR